MANTDKNQKETLAHATRYGAEWTISEIQDLEELRAAGFEMKDIALYLNRSLYGASSMSFLLNSNREAIVRPTKSYSKGVAINAQATPPCGACWMFHPGDC
jgi:hypothetical protein